MTEAMFCRYKVQNATFTEIGLMKAGCHQLTLPLPLKIRIVNAKLKSQLIIYLKGNITGYLSKKEKKKKR